MDELNIYGWIFQVSLAIFLIGILGWRINHFIVGTKIHFDKSSKKPEYSFLQSLLLPKRRARGGYWANQKHYEYINEKSRNQFYRFSLMLVFIGLLVQIGLWIYVYNFTTEGFSFLGPVS